MTETPTTTARKGRGRPRKTAATTPVPLVSTAIVEATGEPAEPQPKQPLTARELAERLVTVAGITGSGPYVTLRMINWDSQTPEIEVYNVVDVLPSGTLLWKRFGEEN